MTFHEAEPAFRPTNDPEGNRPTPDPPANFSSCRSLPHSTSRGSPPHDDAKENHIEPPQSPIASNSPTSPSETHPAGFRSKVTTRAAIEASELRRKFPAKYFCKYCERGFTRKSNLDREPCLQVLIYFLMLKLIAEHHQSHLGVPNKLCNFCGQMFMSSISRHKRSCKQNPERQGTNRQLEAEPEENQVTTGSNFIQSF